MEDAAKQRFIELNDRQVGFECFDPSRVRTLPKGTYLAHAGNKILIVFHEQERAEEFFQYHIQETL